MTLQRTAGRLPAPTPAFLSLPLLIRALRGKHSGKWCKDNLVGAMRRELEERAKGSNIHFMVRSAADTTLMESEEQTREYWRLHCAMCGGCSMAQR